MDAIGHNNVACIACVVSLSTKKLIQQFYGCSSMRLNVEKRLIVCRKAGKIRLMV